MIKIMIQHPGIEPGALPWKGNMLPLHQCCWLYYIKIKKIFNFNECFYLNFCTFRTEDFIARMVQHLHKLTHWSTLT